MLPGRAPEHGVLQRPVDEAQVRGRVVGDDGARTGYRTELAVEDPGGRAQRERRPGRLPGEHQAPRVEVLVRGMGRDPGGGCGHVAPLTLADRCRGRQAVLDADDRRAAVGEPPVQRGAVVALAAHPAPAVHPDDDGVRAGTGGPVEAEVQRATELVDAVLLGAVRAPVGLAGDGKCRPPVDVDALHPRRPGLTDQHPDEGDRRDEGDPADHDAGPGGPEAPGQSAEPDAQERRQGRVQGVLPGDEGADEPDTRQPRRVGPDGDDQDADEPHHTDHADQPHQHLITSPRGTSARRTSGSAPGVRRGAP